MKAVFICLLLTNLLYFGYEFYYAEPTHKVAVSAQNPVSGEKIILLSELDGQAQRSAEDFKSIVKGSIRQDANQPRNCRALGPFRDLVIGQQALAQIAAIDSNVTLQAIDSVAGGSDYRVMIPAAPSAEEAFRKLRELKSRKIDSYVITQGSEALAISLGVFSTEAAALQLKNNVAEQGYEAEIVTIPRINREFWVFSTSADDLVLSDGFWQGMQKNFPNTTLRKQQCITGQ